MGKKKDAGKTIVGGVKESPGISAKLLPDVFESTKEIQIVDCKFYNSNTLPYTKGPDILLLVEPEDGELFLFHIEFRDDNRDAYLGDMLVFHAAITLLYGEFNLEQYLIYTGNEPVNMKDKTKARNLTYKMFVVDIREVDRDEHLSSYNNFRKLLGIICDIKRNSPAISNNEIQRRVINAVNTGNFRMQASSVPSIKDMDDIDNLIYSSRNDSDEWYFLKDLLTRLGPELDFKEIKRLIIESDSPDTVSKYLERYFT